MTEQPEDVLAVNEELAIALGRAERRAFERGKALQAEYPEKTIPPVEQPEVTRAIEAVAAQIWRMYGGPYHCDWSELSDDSKQGVCRRLARQILSLPMVRVVADEQKKPKLSKDKDSSLYSWAWAEGQESMISVGFQRVFEVKGE